MEKLRIDYRNESGGECFMELNCAVFFPCTKRDAKIVFPLAVKNCTSETIHELKQHFVDAKHPVGIRATEEELSAARGSLIEYKAQSRFALGEVKRNRRLISKYAENIELLEQYTAKFGV